MNKTKLILQKVKEEQFQGHSTRKDLYGIIEKELNLPIISFFTSFLYPVMIENSDADMLEGILHKYDLKEGFILFLSSPGGSGLAAERIIKVCREHSGKIGYQVIIPGKAKSAATMICLGANKIIMGNTSEVGPIDPQISFVENDKPKTFSVHNIVKSYNQLFEEAVKTKGNLQPYIQQLEHYDSREIEEYKNAIALSGDIAVKALKTGMLNEKTETEIKKSIKDFLSPEKVKVHARSIYAEEAKKCGLNIEIIDLKSNLWQIIYELYVRLDNCVSTNNVVKCIESKDYSWLVKIRGV